MMPIALLSPGECAQVVSVGGRGPDRCDEAGLGRAEDLGLRCGQSVQMLTNSGSGPILLKVDNTRIAIGRNLAHRVLVSHTEGENR